MRGNNRESADQEQRPLWDTPERLFGITGLRITECEDEERPAGMRGNPSHLILSTQETLHRQTRRVLDFAGEVLAIRSEGPWRWQRPFFQSLLRNFFDEGSDSPAWVSVIPFRWPHQHRFNGRALTTAEHPEPAVAISPATSIRNWPLALGRGIYTVDAENLLLAYQPVCRGDTPDLLRQGRLRTVAGPGYGESYDSMFYLGHQDADQEKIAKAHIPAMGPYYDPELRMLRTASITLAKMVHVGCGEVTQLIVTLQPEDGKTVALVTGGRSLYTYLQQYPTDHSLLTKGRSGDA